VQPHVARRSSGRCRGGLFGVNVDRDHAQHVAEHPAATGIAHPEGVQRKAQPATLHDQ
jgi:hypothetical protein